jgi:hypothetical protein
LRRKKRRIEGLLADPTISARTRTGYERECEGLNREIEDVEVSLKHRIPL